ncbi:hypothetical protein DINM_004096 [Dirofilaria immitis]|nr:hypothetical protein [Dirofilaria immitis]
MIKQQERADEYRNELEAMKQRVRSRALIVEQQEMLIKMQRFERKYKETVAGTPKKTRKISIQNQHSNRFNERMMMINSDQQAMLISGKDHSSNEMQTSKTETNNNSLLISDIDDSEKKTKCINDGDNIIGDNDDDNNYTDYDDDDDDDYDDDDDSSDDNNDDDLENEGSESENNDFDETFVFESKIVKVHQKIRILVFFL